MDNDHKIWTTNNICGCFANGGYDVWVIQCLHNIEKVLCLAQMPNEEGI